MNKLCDYGCGKKALYPPGKRRKGWCCSESPNSCTSNREKNRLSHIGEKNHMFCISKELHPMFGKKQSEESNKKNRETQKGRKWEEIFGIEKSNKLKERWKVEKKITIEKIKIRYPFFSKVEEMRYNPEKPGEKEIQVHCKNHNCPNSKEKGGWFTPIRYQLSDRIRSLEKIYGNDGSYFYCSDECKHDCPLYYSRGIDSFKNKEKFYTLEEYKTFRQEVLKRDDYKCQYCENKAEHVHHERPKKLEPFFSLDPDYGISVCKECHYKYGHKDECSIGSISNKICG